MQQNYFLRGNFKSVVEKVIAKNQIVEPKVKQYNKKICRLESLD